MNILHYILLIIYGIILGTIKGALIRFFKLKSKETEGLQPLKLYGCFLELKTVKEVSLRPAVCSFLQ